MVDVDTLDLVQGFEVAEDLCRHNRANDFIVPFYSYSALTVVELVPTLNERAALEGSTIHVLSRKVNALQQLERRHRAKTANSDQKRLVVADAHTEVALVRKGTGILTDESAFAVARRLNLFMCKARCLGAAN